MGIARQAHELAVYGRAERLGNQANSATSGNRLLVDLAAGEVGLFVAH